MRGNAVRYPIVARSAPARAIVHHPGIEVDRGLVADEMGVVARHIGLTGGRQLLDLAYSCLNFSVLFSAPKGGESSKMAKKERKGYSL